MDSPAVWLSNAAAAFEEEFNTPSVATVPPSAAHIKVDPSPNSTIPSFWNERTPESSPWVPTVKSRIPSNALLPLEFDIDITVGRSRIVV